MQHDFILLDRSSSMSTMWGEALASVNGYVKKLADDGGIDTGVTLAVFDTNHDGKLDFNVIRDRIVPKTWKPVANDEASPRGSTPLNDATGRIVGLANAGAYDKVAIIIMTDGHENSSRELSRYQVKAMLDQCRAKNWQVIFPGGELRQRPAGRRLRQCGRTDRAVGTGEHGRDHGEPVHLARVLCRLRGGYWFLRGREEALPGRRVTYEAFWGTFWVGIMLYRLVSTGALSESALYWQAYMEGRQYAADRA